MIGKLKGTVEAVYEDSMLLDVGGVCYLVYASGRLLQQLPAIGEAQALEIETHVREDHIHLYGFSNAIEKQWFNLLCTVQGVGAKMALGILSSFSPAELAQAIHARDSKLLTRANGVGPKLGERLVTELKNKIAKLPTSEILMPTHDAASKVTDAVVPLKNTTPTAKDGAIEEAVSALANLGYGRSEAYSKVSEVLAADPDAALADMIRLSLQRLSA